MLSVCYITLEISHYIKLNTEIHFFSVASFQNADVTHTNGKVQVDCHEHFIFDDGTLTKAWTCGETLPQDHKGCVSAS